MYMQYTINLSHRKYRPVIKIFQTVIHVYNLKEFIVGTYNIIIISLNEMKSETLSCHRDDHEHL